MLTPTESQKLSNEPHQQTPILDHDDDEALTLLDTFDFDERMPSIINLTESSSSSASSETSVGEGTSSPMASSFMLGDYSEKELFMPSTGIVRNEVLECVPLDGINGGTEMTFRCIFCKHAIERAHGAVIRPQVSQ